jgi:hypothetical protein
MILDLDARLAEEVVSLALRSRPAADYWKERERIYALPAAEEREREFERLALDHLEALQLAAPIRQAIEEAPLVATGAARCRVVRAFSRRDEGAELFVAPDTAGKRSRESRSVLLKLRAEVFLDPPQLLACLRHELLHIADMLDPDFGYDPALPEASSDPARTRIVIGRYRALWDTVIDGRLAARGWAPDQIRARRRDEFRRSFPMLAAAADAAFERWFDEPRPRHGDLLRFACEPVAAER